MSQIVTVTNSMLKAEKIISFYNKKFLFQGVQIPAEKKKTYDFLLSKWDTMKGERNKLKAQLFLSARNAGKSVTI